MVQQHGKTIHYSILALYLIPLQFLYLIPDLSRPLILLKLNGSGKLFFEF